MAFDEVRFPDMISRAKDDADAMRLANESRYGLGGGIFLGTRSAPSSWPAITSTPAWST